MFQELTGTLPLEEIRTFVFLTLQIAGLLAIVVWVLVELFKYLRRPVFYEKVLDDWRKGLPEHSPIPALKLLKARGGLPYHIYRLPRRLFMQQVEAAVQIALLDTSYDRVIQENHAEPTPDAPRSHEQRREFDSDEADLIATVVQRDLDQLQLLLSLRWIVRVRTVAIVAGAALGFALALVATFSIPSDGTLTNLNSALTTAYLTAIGAASGFLATLVHDLISRLLPKSHDGY